jgi:hypothetical protein
MHPGVLVRARAEALVVNGGWLCGIRVVLAVGCGLGELDSHWDRCPSDMGMAGGWSLGREGGGAELASPTMHGQWIPEFTTQLLPRGDRRNINFIHVDPTSHRRWRAYAEAPGRHLLPGFHTGNVSCVFALWRVCISL